MITAPIGTSSRMAARFASSIAASIALRSGVNELFILEVLTDMTPPRKETDNPAPKTGSPGERLAKRMAAAGLCSRRAAEELIAQGVVKVNGVRVTTPATCVVATDRITVRGKELPAPSDIRVFLFHKPAGLVTTARDEQGRATVFDGLPPELPRLISAGRLDLNSEGLLVLTTSGAFARHLELPATGLPRTYRVRIFGDLRPEMVARLARGIRVDGVSYGPVEVVPERGPRGETSRNQWVRVSLREGKNREIRKVFGAFGIEVNRLIRLSHGPFELSDLPRGALVEVTLGFLKKHFPEFFGSSGEASSRRKAPKT